MSSERTSRTWLSALRLLAATAVLVDHAYKLSGRPNPVVLAWADRQLSLGGLAVLVFFVLSGYLVTSSWLAQPHLVTYLRKRALRIFPGLAVALLITTFVFGPLMTTLPLRDYLTDSATGQYLRSILLTPVQMHLPGVFTGNPGNDYANGSLWTLPIELLCYCLVGVAGMLAVFTRRWPVPVAAMALLLVTDRIPALTATGMTDAVAFFMLGSAVRSLEVPMRPRLAALAALGLGVSLLSGFYGLGALALAYLIVFIGMQSSGPLAHADRWGDPSYGVYIYGYPLQQSLVATGLVAVGPLTLVSITLALLLGYSSWHLVEKRAVGSGRRRPPASPSSSTGREMLRLDAPGAAFTT